MENRTQTRRKTLKHGSLSLKPGGAGIDCIIRDLSAGGARIWRPYWITLPTRFQLAIPGELTVEAELRWQAGQEAGVRFVGRSVARSSRKSFGRSGQTAA